MVISLSPKLSNTVSVVGEVKRSGTHTFQPELSLDDYVDFRLASLAVQTRAVFIS